jgi:Skp family chaperone for outer membrane proteins
MDILDLVPVSEEQDSARKKPEEQEPAKKKKEKKEAREGRKTRKKKPHGKAYQAISRVVNSRYVSNTFIQTAIIAFFLMIVIEGFGH